MHLSALWQAIGTAYRLSTGFLGVLPIS